MGVVVGTRIEDRDFAAADDVAHRALEGERPGIVGDHGAHARRNLPHPVGLEIEWTGMGVEERGVCNRTGKVLVAVDPRYFRPTEVELLIGDPSRAHQKLGWKHDTTWQQLCEEMVAQDVRNLTFEKHRNVD